MHTCVTFVAIYIYFNKTKRKHRLQARLDIDIDICNVHTFSAIGNLSLLERPMSKRKRDRSRCKAGIRISVGLARFVLTTPGDRVSRQRLVRMQHGVVPQSRMHRFFRCAHAHTVYPASYVATVKKSGIKWSVYPFDGSYTQRRSNDVTVSTSERKLPVHSGENDNLVTVDVKQRRCFSDCSSVRDLIRRFVVWIAFVPIIQRDIRKLFIETMIFSLMEIEKLFNRNVIFLCCRKTDAT